MNIELEITKLQSQRHLTRLAAWIGNDTKRFSRLMHIFLFGTYRDVQRASWVVSSCVEEYPFLAAPWLPEMIRRAEEPGVHVAVRRNVVRLLQFVEIPRRLQGEVVNLCFTFLTAIDSPVAVKVFSMSVLANIAKKEPDLRNEIRPLIEQMLPYGSPGIRSRATKVLKQLSDL